MVPLAGQDAVDLCPVDLQALARLMGRSDSALLNQILAVFWQTEAETPHILRRLAQARDGQALADAAHCARGVASSACAAKVAHLCKDLERSAHSGDWDSIALLTAQVEQAYAEVGAFIEKARH